MTGLAILAAAAVVAVAFGLYRRHVDGRFVAHADATPTAWDHVAAAASGTARGERATLVQFSSAFCAPCRTARVVLSDVAAHEDGVHHVEIDAEQHLDLVRTLDVRRTPTTLILDPGGHEVLRAAGAPQKRQVLAAIAQIG
ncbi:thioredoxin family protein [Nocardioides bizhenqiangii]|uniref:Thioredoxin family protein n=1 Tax=Nocardioides bizhenqiangii TaxID=3095076 RepID=A0ABZ0ZNM1_9ACTN|nr:MULTISPECIES: thioredoxin family protein [unclassified Nocardioides]MDZ5620022.1 thioredoxin family protein [Nocardioides sp. HM23]WQQ25976.1 thioredoxin family protein [Nocardioides sp. HM61]